MKILFIIPSEKKQAGEWVEGLSELSLLADIQSQYVPWAQPITGAAENWLTVVKALIDHWQSADGFVIWAPDQSLLEISGLLELSLNDPGKPVVLFSAPSPDSLNEKKFGQLHLKSVLIKAAYLAQADVAGVFLLSNELVMRPSSAHWQEDERGFFVASREKPLAKLTYALEPYTKLGFRHERSIEAVVPDHLSTNATLQTWVPGAGLSVDEKHMPIITVASAYWLSPEFQHSRSVFSEHERPVIWLLENGASIPTVGENERIVAGLQAWWVYLASRFALSVTNDRKAALVRFDTLIT